jgi:hypothetical protein
VYERRAAVIQASGVDIRFGKIGKRFGERAQTNASRPKEQRNLKFIEPMKNQRADRT